ncbi:MAG: nickel-responsive transcriptional regulator NikR [Actinomycetia bacterium]|nr:nickel-responsive transcriptional regulator NikR [Actinomycetes bacterium]
MTELARFGVSMDEDMLQRFDEYVARRGLSTNRSEAIRDLVREVLAQEEIGNPDKEAVASVTMVFSHHAGDLIEKLDSIEHDFFKLIISKVHIHLDAHNCLEVILMRGPAAQVRSIAENLLGAKGVRNGKLVLTTIDE